MAPTVATVYRQLAPNMLRKKSRDETRRTADHGGSAITSRLGSDGIIVREVLLRDLKLPDEYSKGLEGLLLKEQQNEQLGTDQEIKLKQAKIAELEAEAQKARGEAGRGAGAGARLARPRAKQT